MTPENFCYWLQGHMELSSQQILTTEQVAIIKEHLNLVFKKETKIPGYTMPLNDSYAYINTWGKRWNQPYCTPVTSDVKTSNIPPHASC